MRTHGPPLKEAGWLKAGGHAGSLAHEPASVLLVLKEQPSSIQALGSQPPAFHDKREVCYPVGKSVIQISKYLQQDLDLGQEKPLTYMKKN